jgi:hypothetical protein
MPNSAIPRRESPVTPAGEGRSTWRKVLEAGADLLQGELEGTTPLPGVADAGGAS